MLSLSIIISVLPDMSTWSCGDADDGMYGMIAATTAQPRTSCFVLIRNAPLYSDINNVMASSTPASVTASGDMQNL